MVIRKYFLNGEETTLDAILEHLEDLLLYNGNSSMWEDFGISFEDEDVEIEFMCDEIETEVGE